MKSGVARNRSVTSAKYQKYECDFHEIPKYECDFKQIEKYAIARGWTPFGAGGGGGGVAVVVVVRGDQGRKINPSIRWNPFCPDTGQRQQCCFVQSPPARCEVWTRLSRRLHPDHKGVRVRADLETVCPI